MKIYSMAATFGKLEHETLTLQPGLNILEAPNEWGKSTWCAFLAAMLYGIDTRAKTTKTALADKEHYLPWSGSPMSGRMDIHWNGRDITIERRTKGRIPLGDFKAYETESGLAVPELTAANCGEKLLGIERNVFLRSAFIRHSDMPVTSDDALRSRLNALVTTGDESGDGERLAKELKELKNRVRYNRTGLLPQAEAQREQLTSKLRELESLESLSEKQNQRLTQVSEWLSQLENHRCALAYTAAQADTQRVAEAKQALDTALQEKTAADAACENLPSREDAEQALHELRKLAQIQQDLYVESRMQPQPPEPPTPPRPFRNMTGEEAEEAAARDAELHKILSCQRNLLPIFGAVLFLVGIAGVFWLLIPGILCMVAGAAFLVSGLLVNSRRKQQLAVLETHYGSADPTLWLTLAKDYARQLTQYQRAKADFDTVSQELSARQQTLQSQIHAFTGGVDPDVCRSRWESVLNVWDRSFTATREAQRAQSHYTALLSMAKTADPPKFPDNLTYSAPETARLLSDGQSEQQLLVRNLSQNRGRMDTLGEKAPMEAQLAALNTRISALEDTYAALTIAQNALAEASAELQRRFAPRIAKRAEELLSALTQGRYDRLMLSEDLSLRAAARNEDTLRDSLWRSDGTADQLYLALRLAVADALAPESPLILDDALIRFDDTRLKAALTILKEESQHRQILLFTCQSRENTLQ